MKGQRAQIQRWPRKFFCSPASRRFKISVSVGMFLLLVYCACHTPSMIGLSGRLDVEENSNWTNPQSRYTILINTWKRYDLLEQTVAHYATCKNVDGVHVIWSEPEKPSEALSSKLVKSVEPHNVKFRFNINEVDELNNRFKPVDDVDTDALFSVDDDVVMSCKSMDLAFSTWKSAPSQIVGFVPRMHWGNAVNGYTYGGWWSVWWTGSYSMVLTKAAFIHKKYMEMYTNDMPSALLDFVKKGRNCEDIAMSFLVANATHAPPIWVKAEIHEIGQTGISSLTGHRERRTHCVNYFSEVFQGMPLVSSRVKIVDAANEWLW